ncbi:MAG: PstS family phosphate ABC transporter substrate-binding protein [Candidatus Thermoplasmatota archaeon]|jgi:phosphate transport system substrate-binding protein|nr:PstS family phosphate ABC transporter substrate-binding protein [Candidatus Thermoplasmatota archaeon]
MKNKNQSQKKMLVIFATITLITIGIVSNCGCVGKNKNTIKIEGAFALTPMMEKWASEYRKIHPEINIDIISNGAGQGMADALLGIADIGMVSREINNTEIQQGVFFVSVVKDAVVATINTNNPVIEEILRKGVTKQQFIDVFITRNITTWGQLVGNESLSNDRIVVYTRSDSCGAAETWAKYLGKYKQNDLINAADSAVNGDNTLAATIQREKFGIGFNNIGYVYTKKLADGTVLPADNIIPVPIDLNENGVLDENENVYANRSTIITAINNYVYPSPPARALHLVTLHNYTGIVKDFVYWILTGGQQYVLDAGYVPLPPETITAQIGYLESGTRPEIER